MSDWLNVGISGYALWPKKETVINFEGYELILKPATKDTEMSIHMDIEGKISETEALTLINRFLSILSWCSDQSMENLYGSSGCPVPIPIPKQSRAIGTGVSSIFAFPFYRSLEKDPKACLALALYREAQSINSGPYEFLSYFKILNIFWKDKKVNGKNEIIEGLRETLPKIKDPLGIERLEKLNKQEEDVAEYLYKSVRCAIAHAYSDPIIDPNDLTALRILSEDTLIIKAVAEYLIETKLNVSRSIY